MFHLTMACDVCVCNSTLNLVVTVMMSFWRLLLMLYFNLSFCSTLFNGHGGLKIVLFIITLIACVHTSVQKFCFLLITWLNWVPGQIYHIHNKGTYCDVVFFVGKAFNNCIHNLFKEKQIEVITCFPVFKDYLSV